MLTNVLDAANIGPSQKTQTRFQTYIPWEHVHATSPIQLTKLSVLSRIAWMVSSSTVCMDRNQHVSHAMILASNVEPVTTAKKRNEIAVMTFVRIIEYWPTVILPPGTETRANVRLTSGIQFF